MDQISGYYRILDLLVWLRSDSSELLRLFDQEYHIFKASPEPGEKVFSVTYRDSGALQEASLELNGTVSSLSGHPNPLALGLQMISAEIMRENRNFLIVHGGVVAGVDGAVVLAGPSGIGKTTLVLKLMEKGFLFLSDDVCPIHRQTHHVYPFPRIPAIDRGSPYMHLIDNWQAKRVTGGKVLLQSHSPLRLGTKSYPIRCVICMDHPQPNPWQVLGLEFKNGSGAGLLTKLGAIPDVSLKQVGKDHSVYEVAYPLGRGLNNRIGMLIKEYRDDLWNVFPVKTSHPDFSGKPRLHRITQDEAAFFLLNQTKHEYDFQTGSKPAFEKHIHQFVELMELLNGAACYHLSPGVLDDTTELVLGTIP